MITYRYLRKFNYNFLRSSGIFWAQCLMKIVDFFTKASVFENEIFLIKTSIFWKQSFFLMKKKFFLKIKMNFCHFGLFCYFSCFFVNWTKWKKRRLTTQAVFSHSKTYSKCRTNVNWHDFQYQIPIFDTYCQWRLISNKNQNRKQITPASTVEYKIRHIFHNERE